MIFDGAKMRRSSGVGEVMLDGTAKMSDDGGWRSQGLRWRGGVMIMKTRCAGSWKVLLPKVFLW